MQRGKVPALKTIDEVDGRMEEHVMLKKSAELSTPVELNQGGVRCARSRHSNEKQSGDADKRVARIN